MPKRSKLPKRTSAQLRPHTSLRGAMRLQGFDEHRIARVLKRQVNRIQRLVSKKRLNAAHEKLFLDVMKECVKIMEPAARANAPQESSAVQLVHDISRPARDPAMRDDFSNSRNSDE